MYENCPIKDKICAACFVTGTFGQGLYCGLKTGENEIGKMDKCPKDKKAKRVANN